MDADDVSVHCGTLRECEDWLDRQENLEREHASVFDRLSRWFRRLLGRDRSESQPSRELEGSDAAAIAERKRAAPPSQTRLQDEDSPPTELK